MEQNKRLLSLDTFRGITIAGMMLVNNPGSWSKVYPPLLHAEWHGCTPTDWVFPFFLFIVGVAIPYAIGSRIAKGHTTQAISRKIIRRTLLIIGIALFLSAFPFGRLVVEEVDGIKSLIWQGRDWNYLRFPGVLQRIALVYCVAAFLFLYTRWQVQLWTGIGLLLLYWFLMTVVPVPGGVAPNLEAETNLGAWLDRTIFGTHLWIQSKTWDPEGLLSTLPAIATGISGVLTGVWLKTNRGAYEKATGILGVGALLIALACIWDLSFPINKKIWTSSYVLYTSGVALLFLGVIYWIADILGYQRWTKPLTIYGMNALFVYMLSVIVAKLMYTIKWLTVDGSVQTLGGWIYKNMFLTWLSDYNASLGYAIMHVLFFWLIAWVMYKRKIFIRV